MAGRTTGRLVGTAAGGAVALWLLRSYWRLPWSIVLGFALVLAWWWWRELEQAQLAAAGNLPQAQ